MKILHVIARLSKKDGGPPKACIEMASTISKRGHHVEIFTMAHDDGPRIDVPIDFSVDREGVAIRYFPAQISHKWPLSTSLARVLRERVSEFDLVHIHSLYLFHGIIAAHYCRKKSIPYVVTPHGSLDPYLFMRRRWRKSVFEHLFEHRNLRQANAIHYTSEEEKLLAESVVHGMAPGVVVPLGLNLEGYINLPPKNLFRVVYPKIGDRFIVLFLGRLNFKKGLDILIPAFSKVALSRKDVQLVLAGPMDSGYGKKVNEWVQMYNLRDRVTITGMLQGEVKLAALRDAAVFALPSYTENFGIAVIEAMACGIPVVISNKVNIWREVAQAGAGIVTECDVSHCARALKKILDDPTLARTIGEQGKFLVKSRFNWLMIGSELERAYQQIISGASFPKKR